MNSFSEHFIVDSERSPLKNTIYKAVLNGCSTYQIIEELANVIEDQQKELAKIKTYGIPPIIMTVSENELDKFKSEWLAEHIG